MKITRDKASCFLEAWRHIKTGLQSLKQSKIFVLLQVGSFKSIREKLFAVAPAGFEPALP